MENSNKCQSCGITLDIGLYGTNADGSASEEFCKICFEQGMLREPNLKPADMIARTAARMVDELNISQDEAQDKANALISSLKRWKIKE